jgi:hypothetical protein
MSFDLDDFLKQNPNLLSSTQREKYLSSLEKPKWLEDVGIKPESVLREGDYKNYLYERSRLNIRPLPFKPIDPFKS